MKSNDRIAQLVAEIVKIRKERGLTQKRLEELSGVKQPVIARMENGTNIPQLFTIGNL